MLGVVIVSYNGRSYLESLLPSLMRQTISQNEYHVVIVDNGSSDGTSDFLASEYSHVAVISLPDNAGFAEANNIGIRTLFADQEVTHVVFLNNDTVVSENFLEVLVQGYDMYPDAASIQTAILDKDGRHIDSVGMIIDKSFSAQNKGEGENYRGQYSVAQEIFGTAASAMIITRLSLESVALSEGVYFDPIYFAYNEDVDLALRLQLAGFNSYYVPGSEVFHVHSATGGSQSKFKAYYIHRNTIFNIVKNATGFSVLSRIGFFLARYIKLFQYIKIPQTPAYKLSKKIGLFAMMKIVMKSWLSVIWYMPYLLRQRYNIQQRQKVQSQKLERWLY